MFERSEVVFKILCAGVGALVLWQVVGAVQRSDPLAGASIPALPSLPASTNIQAGAKGTNALTQVTSPGTNAPQEKLSADGTNAVAHSTNVVAHGTNLVAQGTNASVPPSAGKARTNPAARPETAAGMMNAGPFPGMPGQGPPLPPAIQARLDRIIESEILAPVIHPQPVALLGIVGRDAFLQAPNGQSGLIKEGEELGGIKLLSLGINRALIEEAGEKKELTLFSGLGSESLLSKQTNNPQ
ncbi:MAG: hypothetical protein ABSH34_09230 [Verrucomicrobiota bacterium]|jgi:hypothetical protein